MADNSKPQHALKVTPQLSLAETSVHIKLVASVNTNRQLGREGQNGCMRGR